MKYVHGVILAVALICSIEVNATEFANCNGCVSNVSYSIAAENEALKNSETRTTVYSFNMASSQIKAYDVYIEYEPGGYAIASSFEKSVDANTQQNFNNLANAYAEVAEHALKQPTHTI